MRFSNMAPMRTARAARSLISKLAVGALAALLAVTVTTVPLSPFANEPAMAEEAGEVTTTLKMATPDLPLAEAAMASEEQAKKSEEGKHSMTFYYLEMVLYDDPEFSHPSNLRLLYTRTVEGLNVGDKLDTWDYVDDIDGYVFFDAFPANPVVGEDNHLNGVEVWYGNLGIHEYTVNTYHVSDGTNENVDIVDPNAVVEDIDGKPVRFQKIDSEVVSDQYFNKKVVGDDVAESLDHMEYLGSYPQSIRVQTDYDKNVINLLYTDNNTTLPDAVEIPAETFGTEPGDDEGSTGNGAGSDTSGSGEEAGDNAGNGTGTAPTTPGNPSDNGTGGTTAGTTTDSGSASGSNTASDPSNSAANAGNSSSNGAVESVGTVAGDAASETASPSNENTDPAGNTNPASETPAINGESTPTAATDTGSNGESASGHTTELVVPLPQTDDAQGNLIPLALGATMAAALATLGAGTMLRRANGTR